LFERSVLPVHALEFIDIYSGNRRAARWYSMAWLVLTQFMFVLTSCVFAAARILRQATLGQKRSAGRVIPTVGSSSEAASHEKIYKIIATGCFYLGLKWGNSSRLSDWLAPVGMCHAQL
jgi:hypothetical protein